MSLTAVLGLVLSLPVAARAQVYTFGDWAADQGYAPGAVMGRRVYAYSDGITSLVGIGDYDWATTPTEDLLL
jgi:hypothetical protein